MANQLKLQVVLEALDRASAPFKSINDKASRMGKTIRQSKSHLKQMQAALKGVQTQQMAMQSRGMAASQSMYTAEQKLQHEIAQTTAAIEKQKNALGRLNQKARQLDKIASTGKRLESGGISIMTNLSLPLGIGVGASVKEAMAVEKSMASIAKFAPEFKTAEAQEKFLGNIKQSIAELSMQSGKTQSDIAAMYEEMGAAGVAADKWQSYSQAFIKGAVALDMEAGQLSQTALGILASTGHKGDDKYLQQILEQANLASDMGKMRAVNVLDVANRSMGLAKNAGIDESAFIGLTGAALDAGAQDDVTGRAWKTIVARLTSTAKLTKGQQAAWDRLKIDPDVFVKAFKKDPIGQMEKLTKAAEKSADGMGDLGIIIGTEFVDTVVKMGSNVDTARKIQASLGDEQLRAMKFAGEYSRMQQTSDANWRRAIQTINHLSATIGEQLLPQFNALLDRIKPIIKQTADWVKANPELTQTILAVVGALVVIGPLLFVVGKGIGAMMIIARVLPLITALSGGFKLLMTTLLANPVVATITALVAAVVLLWQNWEEVNKWFKTDPFAVAMRRIPLVDAAIRLVSGAIETVVALCNGDWQGAWEGAKTVASAALDIVLAPAEDLIDLVKKLASYVGVDLGAAFESLKTAIEPILNFIKNSVGGLIGMIGKAIDGLKSLAGMQPTVPAMPQATKQRLDKFDKQQANSNFLASQKRAMQIAQGGAGKPRLADRWKAHQAAKNKVTKIAPVTVTKNQQQTLNQTIKQSITVNAAKTNTVAAIKAGAAKAASAGARQGGKAALADSARRF